MKLEHRDKHIQVGLRIAYFRKKHNLTQHELADIVHISDAYMSHIEAPNMAKQISLDLLFSIAEALEIKPSKILEFEEPYD